LSVHTAEILVARLGTATLVCHEVMMDRRMCTQIVSELQNPRDLSLTVHMNSVPILVKKICSVPRWQQYWFLRLLTAPHVRHIVGLIVACLPKNTRNYRTPATYP
jgi:hypothetical protein